IEAWKGVVVNPRQSQLNRVPTSQTVRDLATIAPAVSHQKMVEHRRRKGIVVAESHIAGVLGPRLAEDGAERDHRLTVSVVIVKTDRNPLLVGDVLVNLDVEDVGGGF